MGRPNSVVDKVVDIRSRQRSGESFAELYRRLILLENQSTFFKDGNEELIRYFPIAIIACSESYFRLAIKELIDHGDPFFSNAEKVCGGLKYDFSVLRAISGKHVTVGEIISYGIQISSLENINTALSTIMGVDFLSELKFVADRWVYEVEGKPKVPIIENSAEVYAGVKKAFEIRHVLCHEFASNYSIVRDEIWGCFKNTAIFLKAAAEFVQDTLYPNSPLTQSAMNVDAENRLQELRVSLRNACDVVRARLDRSRKQEFDEAQSRWEDYCDAWAKFETDFASGGTIRPLLYGNVAIQLTKQRIEEVKLCTGGDLS